MTEKIYMTSQQMATFVCPKCSRSKTVSVSKYANVDKLIKVNVKCPCGHTYTSILEKRKQYRKATSLPGSFIHFIDGRPVNRGVMTVEDISSTGMKLKLNAPQGFVQGLCGSKLHPDKRAVDVPDNNPLFDQCSMLII